MHNMNASARWWPRPLQKDRPPTAPVAQRHGRAGRVTPPPRRCLHLLLHPPFTCPARLSGFANSSLSTRRCRWGRPCSYGRCRMGDRIMLAGDSRAESSGRTGRRARPRSPRTEPLRPLGHSTNEYSTGHSPALRRRPLNNLPNLTAARSRLR
ncbi:hypothetical protein CALCODRAFT_34909 [Calocera cornea HHB12733]|uniref:Uncharacterized protein n=1 Tax=Calocera cornea HHB12733 TaxID=1353952 RepID=A0A165E0D6_9BASI|nr:hypothetical protein CALCODRAFT_34909 [Calocera cornea HHB12733]